MSDEQAFPCDARSNWMSPGMTLRDYFAAKAMQALITRCTLLTIREEVEEAYRYADEMLKARDAR